MPPLNTDKFIKATADFTTAIGSGGVSDAVVTTIPLVSVIGLPTDTAVQIVVDRVDANGAVTPAKKEVITGVISGTNLITSIRGVEGTAQAHTAGAVVEVILTADQWNIMIDALLTSINQDGSLKRSAIDSVKYAVDDSGDDDYTIELDPAPTAYYEGMEVNFKPITANTGACTLNLNGLGAKDIKKNGSSDLDSDDILVGQLVKVIYDGTNFQFISSIPSEDQKLSEGQLVNGKIVPSVTSDNLTLALKTLTGTDPSVTDPVRIMINGTERIITSALSVTVNSGVSTFRAGSADFATKEIDFFAYLGYNAIDGVVIGISRIPWAENYDDFSTTVDEEKYCAISTITTASATDYYNLIGRFGATLSAGAGYTWTVPTFTAKNLIQRPIYNSRVLDWDGNLSGISSVGSETYQYRLEGRLCHIIHYSSGAVSNALTKSIELPFRASKTVRLTTWGLGGGVSLTARLDFQSGDATLVFRSSVAGNNWATSGDFSVGVNESYLVA